MAQFTRRLGTVPSEQWSTPIAPYAVSVIGEGYVTKTAAAKVRFELFAITQDGPDAARVFRELPLMLPVDEAKQLIADLTAAVQYIEGGEETW
ncbi:hypothetical protein ACFWWU_37080 [Streptomyces sp. NPDC058650]|uniref:hypothetical protein n=1 Tax=Streptomyces sp. NPDC058650 TaxID=3346575 RepID=UPI003661D078